MRFIPLRLWLMAGLSAFLQIVSFPFAGPLPMWRSGLAWFALVPLLHALLEHSGEGRCSVRQAFALGYGCGWLWYMGTCSWIYQTMYLYGGLPKPVAVLILCLFSLYLGLYHALFATLVVAVSRSRFGSAGALGLTPFLWVAVELARARVTGFPWNLLGNSQIDNSLLTKLAPWGGVFALSFVVVCGSSLLSTYLLGRRGRPFIGFALVLIAFAVLASLVPSRAATSSASATAVLLQENLEVGAAGRGSRPLTREQELALFSQLSLHPSTSSGVGVAPAWVVGDAYVTPSVIIWPEAPSHLESSDPAFRARLGALARQSSATVIAGSLGVDLSAAAERGYFLYDSASLFDQTGIYKGRYDKIHLVPWGEYVPFKQFFRFAEKLTEGVGDMDRGVQRTVFRDGGHTYGVFICYESIFGDEVRQFVRNGAQVLVNISDDGWYGDTSAPWQHLNMVRMRAIENHRWILRSTNTGVTTAIDPYGKIAFEAPRHVRGTYVFPFGFEQDETFYTRHGDWLAWLCAGVSACGLALSSTRKMN